MMHSTPKASLLVITALALAACGGGGSSQPSTRTGVTRGAITAKSAGALTVNGVQLSTASAAVRIDDTVHPESDLKKGMVVTVHGTFDDRSGDAAEIEMEHGVEGQIEDLVGDDVIVGGQVVHVDGSTEIGLSVGNPLAIGSVVAVSGVPDDHGGLRASRIDDSPRASGPAAGKDDLDIRGFVSNASGTSFQLRLSPDAAGYYVVNASALALPANGAFVEVRSAGPAAPGTPPVLGTITATAVQVEDRFGAPEVEIEGIVTSGDSAQFVVDGQTIRTDGGTRWELGAPADLVAGVKVEVEGSVTGGILQASRVSFRAGVRVTASLENVSWNGASGSATILGIAVELPSFARYDATPANGLRVELRASPDAAGTGLVASRVTPNTSGNTSRVFLRAVVSAKSSANPAAPTFTVFGLTVTTSGATFHASDGQTAMSAADFTAAVEPGRTVIKARAASVADVSGSTFAAEEVELEGNE